MQEPINFLKVGLPIQDIEKMETVRLLIESNHVQRHTVDELAKTAGMSNTKFKTSFTSYFGCSAFAFIQERRLKEAYKLVCANYLPIKEIAGICGYQHASHFNRAFKKRFAITANSVRKQLSQQRFGKSEMV